MDPKTKSSFWSGLKITPREAIAKAITGSVIGGLVTLGLSGCASTSAKVPTIQSRAEIVCPKIEHYTVGDYDALYDELEKYPGLFIVYRWLEDYTSLRDAVRECWVKKAQLEHIPQNTMFKAPQEENFYTYPK